MGNDKQAIAKQLKALRDLAWWYHNAHPIRFEAYGDTSIVSAEAEQRMAKAHLETARQVRAAQKKLLASGFDVPGSWLNLNPVGNVNSQSTRLDVPKSGKGKSGKIKPGKWKTVLTWKLADPVAVEKACEEMSIAILRLEAQLDGPQAPAAGQQPRWALLIWPFLFIVLESAGVYGAWLWGEGDNLWRKILASSLYLAIVLAVCLGGFFLHAGEVGRRLRKRWRGED